MKTYCRQEISRGDIYYADLRPVIGSEQGGIRPVLILQNNVGNRHSPTVIAAPITSKMGKPRLPIINLPHPTSAKHPRMPLSDRAAQFAPFAALSGHSAALVETARLTDQRMELDEDARAALDSKQQLLLERIKERPEITVTWFQPDAKKDGGRYIVSTGRLKRIHEADQVLILVDGLRIPIGDIVELESECIRGLL